MQSWIESTDVATFGPQHVSSKMFLPRNDDTQYEILSIMRRNSC